MNMKTKCLPVTTRGNPAIISKMASASYQSKQKYAILDVLRCQPKKSNLIL